MGAILLFFGGVFYEMQRHTPEERGADAIPVTAR
jgi:hypothetical protein